MFLKDIAWWFKTNLQDHCEKQYEGSVKYKETNLWRFSQGWVNYKVQYMLHVCVKLKRIDF